MTSETNKEVRHKARQQKVKEQVDAKVAAAQEETNQNIRAVRMKSSPSTASDA